jgi:hypothetical protein
MEDTYRVTRKCYDYTDKRVTYVRYNVTASSPKQAKAFLEFPKCVNLDSSPNRLYDWYTVIAVKLTRCVRVAPHPNDIPPFGKAKFISWEIRPIVEE